MKKKHQIFFPILENAYAKFNNNNKKNAPLQVIESLFISNRNEGIDFEKKKLHYYFQDRQDLNELKSDSWLPPNTMISDICISIASLKSQPRKQTGFRYISPKCHSDSIGECAGRSHLI